MITASYYKLSDATKCAPPPGFQHHSHAVYSGHHNHAYYKSAPSLVQTLQQKQTFLRYSIKNVREVGISLLSLTIWAYLGLKKRVVSVSYKLSH